MRKPLVAGNWKMNGSTESINKLVKGIRSGMDSVKNAGIIVCPPYVYIPAVVELLASSGIAIGAQNVAKEQLGAFTGEVSACMLKDIGCQFVIVGHSERRALFGDTNAFAAQKFAAIQQGGLTPIFCVGESLEERDTGKTEAVVQAQLEAVVELLGVAALDQSVIAYEPVWAIGTGKTASPEQAQEVHAFIRGWIAKQDKALADKIQILYGGSVKAANAKELFSQPDIDGGLIGGASLDADEFLNICKAAG